MTEICKAAAVKAIGRAEADDLVLINRLARRELTADEVYTFAVRLCDNDIDRDFERFDEAALEALGELNGKRIREDLVQTIFSRFCVGK